MKTFLQEVAHDLYQKTEGDFSHVAVVFPNKRASLFFNECLIRESEHPLWSPAYISISELFRQSSSWQTGDPVKLVCDLYKVFRQVTGSSEPLDNFYFWGEMLIADFDDADKNLADTDALFSNLKELNALTDNYDFLEEGQKEALAQFFRNFSMDSVTELKQRFISIWDTLGDIYTRYKALLESQGIAYEGMMYRRVIETLDVRQLPYKTYVFVGFNVLNKVEHTLFQKLNDAGKALFYWDYDMFYLKRTPHEAGEFIRRNLHDFPSELPAARFENLEQPKEITFAESPTENGQTRFLPQWLRKNLTQEEKETAIVLCNESLLQPVLHSLPENVKHINITMGFPLSQTPAYSFANALLELHTSGYDSRNGRYHFKETVSQYADSGLKAEDFYIFPVGRKMADAVRKMGLQSQGDYSHMADKPSYAEASELADRLMGLFAARQVDRIELVYNHCKSTSVQIPVRETYLPVSPERQAALAGTGDTSDYRQDYIVEPDRETVLEVLLPKVLKLKIYAVLLDANAAEHSARTVAMQTATDNGKKLLQDLTVQFNKQRQQSITDELLDMVGGTMA